jgi:ubiquinone/menaquinone biosynthesis C-methylase UbiE
MTEMNPVSRFFVNSLTGRRNRRRWEWLRTRLPPTSRPTCLEIGCGNGDFAALFIDGAGPGRYVATDLDSRQLEAARRHLAARYPAGLPASLVLDEADMLELPYADGEFDLVFAFVAIHHANPNHREFTNIPTALSEIDRVLRSGGSVAYEEFVHKERIRAWFGDRGYLVTGDAPRWNREMVVLQKPGHARPAAPPGAPGPAPPNQP